MTKGNGFYILVADNISRKELPREFRQTLQAVNGYLADTDNNNVDSQEYQYETNFMFYF